MANVKFCILITTAPYLKKQDKTENIVILLYSWCDLYVWRGFSEIKNKLICLHPTVQQCSNAAIHIMLFIRIFLKGDK